jgi:hypothetical protein
VSDYLTDMPLIKLSSIICQTPDESDKDEIYLKVKGKKIWPMDARYVKIDVDEQVNINLKFRASKGLWEIELWEYDLTSKNDHLGNFLIDVKDGKGSFTDMLTVNEDVTDHADYVLNWEILG